VIAAADDKVCRVRLWFWLALLAACYQPAFAPGLPCASNGECPSSQLCDYAATPPTCVTRLPDVEPESPDAAVPAPDAPPADAGSAGGSAIDAPLPVDAAAADAPPIVAPVDAPSTSPPSPPIFLAAGVARAAAVATFTYSVTIPGGSNRFLVVSVQEGSDCAAPVPTVTSVEYGGVAMTRVTSVLGTPCNTTTTRSEQWQLIAPAAGTHDVVVRLSGTALTIHSDALSFAGVNQTTPVRAVATGRGNTAAAAVTVSSAAGDLVVSMIGAGAVISGPGAGQTQRFLDNAGPTGNLDNSAGSTAPGAASTIAMAWTMAAADQWQIIALSLRP
jgi:hypothetical protein